MSRPALFLTTLIPAGPPHLARYARHPLPQGGEGRFSGGRFPTPFTPSPPRGRGRVLRREIPDTFYVLSPKGGEGGPGGPVEVIVVKNYEGHHTSDTPPAGRTASLFGPGFQPRAGEATRRQAPKREQVRHRALRLAWTRRRRWRRLFRIGDENGGHGQLSQGVLGLALEHNRQS